MCVWGVHLTTLGAAAGWGVPACPPGEPGPAPWDVRPHSAFAARVPGPRGPRRPVRRALRGSELLVRAAGSRLRSPGTPLAAGRGASSAAALGERGESRVHPLPRSPPPPTRAAPRRSGRAYPGQRPDGTLLLLRLPLAGRASPQSPTGHPSPPPGAGDRLASGPRQVAAFRPSACLSEPDGLQLAATRSGIQPSLLETEGFPASGCLLPLPSGRPRPTVPRPAGSSLFPRRVSHPLRCVWVISLDSTTGSCCRARLPDVGRAALEGGVCCGPGVG